MSAGVPSPAVAAWLGEGGQGDTEGPGLLLEVLFVFISPDDDRKLEPESRDD